MKVLVLGASGMLGNAVLRFFSASPGFEVFGTVRSADSLRLLPADLQQRISYSGDVESMDGSYVEGVLQLLDRLHPEVVINCIGVVKQLAAANDVLTALPVNSLLPHRLVRLCRLARARLIHISTDCVFSGAAGMYREQDTPDASDLYGVSKRLGEVDDPQAITLRTSIIGPELAGGHGLLAWFLAQRGRVKGFTRAIFSGLPTVELARLMREVVIPHPELHGLHHVSAEPISKYRLLQLFAQVYGVSIEIEPDAELIIDRSLDSSRFRRLTGWTPPPWPELVRTMHQFG